MNRTLEHYRRNKSFLIRDYNKDFPMAYYFAPMIAKRGKVKIAELGAGFICTIGNVWAGSHIYIYASDILQPEFKKIWDSRGYKLVVPIEYEDMENLSYEDDYFDIVHCANALDHTEDAEKALNEMKRVCKPGGWIYLRHYPNQKKRYGGMHRWNASVSGFSNGETLVGLDGFRVIDDGCFIIATWVKPMGEG